MIILFDFNCIYKIRDLSPDSYRDETSRLQDIRLQDFSLLPNY